MTTYLIIGAIWQVLNLLFTHETMPEVWNDSSRWRNPIFLGSLIVTMTINIALWPIMFLLTAVELIRFYIDNKEG